MISPSQLLPTDRETLFLRACLREGASARDAWGRWLDAVTRAGMPARRALVPVNALLPLLAWNLQRTGAALDPGLQTHLRSAVLTEELRWQKYRAICESAFRLLREPDVPFIALKGAVVGEIAYPAPHLRHADDIDVLLHAHDLGRAADLLVRAGWRQEPPPVLRSPLHVPPLVHPKGVPIELHWRLLIPHYTIPYDRLWERSRITSIGGIDVRVLSEPDSLLHTCAHGMHGTPDLKWVADAWFILEKSPHLDWSIFTATTISARLELPMYNALRYMAEHIGAPVPERVLEDLQPGAARTGFAGRSAARRWPTRRAFPPPVQFALHYDVRLWTVPFYYLYRLARYALGSVSGLHGSARLH